MERGRRKKKEERGPPSSPLFLFLFPFPHSLALTVVDRCITYFSSWTQLLLYRIGASSFFLTAKTFLCDYLFPSIGFALLPLCVCVCVCCIESLEKREREEKDLNSHLSPRSPPSPILSLSLSRASLLLLRRALAFTAGCTTKPSLCLICYLRIPFFVSHKRPVCAFWVRH